MKVTLRPLQESDALISWKWRNDSRVWKYTGKRPSMPITEDIERDWIRVALVQPDERRFAICIGEAQVYVGNVQLTHITGYDAEFHIFVGEVSAQGKGIGTRATQWILDYARDTLGLQRVHLSVHPDNAAAIRSYEKCGFELSADDGTRLIFIRNLNL